MKNNNTPFCIGEVVRKSHKHTGADVDGSCGKVQAGDDVVELQCWMLLENGGGSSTYQWTERKVLALMPSTALTVAAASES